MNTFIKAIVLSISTALVTAPAMAAPQHEPVHPSQQKHQAPVQKHNKRQQTAKHSAPVKQQQSNFWKTGEKLPSQYRAQSYKVDHSAYKKLSKPGHNQQWIKVHGDYLLINKSSHSILRVVHG